MRDLESTIIRGFEKKNLQAQKMTFEALQKVLARKVKRKYEMNEDEHKALVDNASMLQAKLGDTLLVQLLSTKLKPNGRLWDLAKLNDLITKVEDWGK